MKEQKRFSLRRIAWIIGCILFIFAVVPVVIKNIYRVEQAFEKTPAGKIEVKIIPASTVLVSEGQGNYFRKRNNLFRRLFNYISANNVSMTTPVEATIENAQMKFYVGAKDTRKKLVNQGGVQVVAAPQRTVLSIGIRGAYTESNFAKAKAQLVQWLREDASYSAAGDAYGVFWDAPFMPWFLKRSEVHIPIERASRK